MQGFWEFDGDGGGEKKAGGGNFDAVCSIGSLEVDALRRHPRVERVGQVATVAKAWSFQVGGDEMAAEGRESLAVQCVLRNTSKRDCGGVLSGEE